MRIAIVEDELLIAQGIAAQLMQSGYEVVGTAINYTEALELIRNEKPDLVLLDVSLAGAKTGIDVAVVLKTEFKVPHIFLTSYADSATIKEAATTAPYGYLVKPVTTEGLYAAIETALIEFNRESRNTPYAGYFVKDKQAFKKIDLLNIKYVMSDGKYLELHFKDGSYELLRQKLEDFQMKFDHLKLFRIHRRYLINLNNITQIKDFSVWLGDIELPVAENRKAELMSMIAVI